VVPEFVRRFVKRYTTLRFRLAVYRICRELPDLAIRALFWTVMLPTLYVLEPIARIRIGELRVDHIGHLAIEPELLVRQGVLDGIRTTLVFVVCKTPANRQLFEMWRRRLRILEIHSHGVRRVFWTLKPLVARSRFGQFLPGAWAGWKDGERCHDVMFRGRPQLDFADDENAYGEAELRRMGVPEGAWFVAFHARDPTYYEWLSGYQTRFERTYRDMAIETMFDAMRHVAASGGYAIRMGAVVEKPLPDLGPRIIDYATHHRSDFMDIYLCAKARFVMASNSGLCSVAQIFDVPLGVSNVFPYNIVPSGKAVRYIRMFLRDRRTGQILPFPEIRRRGLLQCHPAVAQEFDTQKYYEDRALDVVHNDGEDITGLCIDLMDLTDRRSPHPEAVRLQNVHRRLYDGPDRSPVAGQIGERFVLRHAALVEADAQPTLTTIEREALDGGSVSA
jgi:putative glycosyltransferase (TIGR04372 family)